MEQEDLRIRVRSYLNKNGIKLWEQPHDADSALQALAARMLQEDHDLELVCDQERCVVVLKELRDVALARISERDRFASSGEATLRIKISGDDRELSIPCKLTELGSVLLEYIATDLGIPIPRLKLIFKGKIVNKGKMLGEQGIRNGNLLLLVILPDDPDSIKKDSDIYDDTISTKRDAELLASDVSNEHYLELEDQYGNPIRLPAKEQKALTIAVTLHERGRTALKSKDYSRALLLLLQADDLYAECNADILKSVDNHGLSNLDIAWCYLHLKSVTHIPDANRRLQICEKNLHNAYGENFQRLAAVKGHTGNEKVLFIRLHLMRGILCYYENKRDEALKILQKVEVELKSSKIDEGSVQVLVDMGYSLSESRLALRACNGTISEAIDFILKQREKREMARYNSISEHRNRALGKCSDGEQFVSAQSVDAMVGMGYEISMAVFALKKFNNNLGQAVEFISEQYKLLQLIPEEHQIMAQQLISQGLDFEKIVERINGFFEDGPGGSNQPGSSQQKDDSKMKRKEAKEAFERLSEAIDVQEDDYLDIDLSEEEEFLKSYMKLLKH